MPIVTMQSFYPTHIPPPNRPPGRPAEFYRWNGLDDINHNDYDFQRVMLYSNAATTAQWFEIDRSGSSPVLRWTDYENNTYELDPGPVGTYWHPAVPQAGLIGPGPGPWDVTGYWRCNQHGRPYDLNDLFTTYGALRVTSLRGNLDGRVLQLDWTPNPDYAAYEVHEFLKTPATTLKATVTEPQRVSGVLAPNQTLEYAVRGKTATGGVGPFSGIVIVTIGANNGTVVPGAPGEFPPSEITA